MIKGANDTTMLRVSSRIITSQNIHLSPRNWNANEGPGLPVAIQIFSRYMVSLKMMISINHLEVWYHRKVGLFGNVILSKILFLVA